MNQPLDVVATAFSQHDFTPAGDRFADDVIWHNVGGDDHRGKSAVVAACEHAAASFAGVQTTITRVRSIVAAGAIVVETVADYVDDNGTSTVASCDIYDVADDRIVAITSYNVEI